MPATPPEILAAIKARIRPATASLSGPLANPCDYPLCRVEPGVMCKDRNGRTLKHFHPERYRRSSS